MSCKFKTYVLEHKQWQTDTLNSFTCKVFALLQLSYSLNKIKINSETIGLNTQIAAGIH